MRRSPHRLTLYIALIATLGLTAIAWHQADQNASVDAAARFRLNAERVHENIDQRMRGYVDALLHLRAHVEALPRLTREEFHDYLDRIDLVQAYPGIQSIAFAQVEDGGRKAPIRFIEPFSQRNRVVLGYDIYSEPVRREAIEQARDTGLPAMTGKIRLVQEPTNERQAGFVICVPVYRRNSPTFSVETRRKALAGYISASFRVGDLFHGIFGSTPLSLVPYAVYDGDPSPQNLLFYHGIDPAVGLRESRVLQVAGRRWSVMIGSLPDEAAAPAVPFLILATGALGSLAILGCLRRQRQYTSQIESALEQSRSAVQMREEILAIVSHDLRNPLTAIDMSASVLERHIDQLSGPRIVEARRQAQILHRSSQRMSRLISDLLDVVKLESGKLPLMMDVSDSLALLEEAFDLLKPVAEQKNVHLVLEPTDEARKLHCDHDRVLQALSNLVGNAAKFTPEGGTIQLRQILLDDTVAYEVEDNGSGIPEEDLPKVFERYWQRNRTTRQGLGLGLFIVRAIVDAHGGQVSIRSKTGVGTTVRLEFPGRVSAAGTTPGLRTQLSEESLAMTRN